MCDTSLYNIDIYAWSEQQAAALRRLASRSDLPNDLDLEHIVEEIEDVGRGELVEVRVLLGRALTRLVLAWAAPDREPDRQERSKIIDWIAEAELRFSATMGTFVALEELWASSVRHAIKRLEIIDDVPAAMRAKTLDGCPCPFTLADLFSESFRIMDALQRLNTANVAPIA